MGAFASLEQNAVVVQAVASAVAATGTRTGREIDTKGYSEALVILTLGDVSATGTLAVKLQDCATTGGTFADVTGAAFSSKAGAVDNLVYIARLKLDGNLIKRFIKFVGVTGTDTVDYAVTVVLSGAQYNPQSIVAAGWAPVAEFTI